jgi:hypothetical protein
LHQHLDVFPQAVLTADHEDRHCQFPLLTFFILSKVQKANSQPSKPPLRYAAPAPAINRALKLRSIS